jgi:NH3-dependent NAD+ synthetase
MITLYQIAGSKGGIVVGTGNKIEDFGVGFFTKYGDGGVDISPIADLTKTEVRKIPEVEKEEREVLNEGLPTPVKSKRKPVVKKPEVNEIIKPLPPPTQIIQEGKDPESEKKKTIKSSTRREQYKKNTQES